MIIIENGIKDLTINANDHNRTTSIKFSKILKPLKNLNKISTLSKKSEITRYISSLNSDTSSLVLVSANF